MKNKKTDEELLVQSQIAKDPTVLNEMEMVRKLKDNDHLLEFLGHSYRRNLCRKKRNKFHMFYGHWTGDSLASYDIEFYTTKYLSKIFFQVGQALEYIHSKGVIHRNITPDSIMFDTQLHVKIVDFSNAVSGPTSRHQYFPKLRKKWKNFDAPEYKAADGYIDRLYGYSVDYYSAGACLYYGWFGCHPSLKVYKKKKPGEQLYCVKWQEPRDPVLADLIKAMLNPVPNLRLRGQKFYDHPFFKERPKPKEEVPRVVQSSCNSYSAERFGFIKMLHRGGFGEVNLLWDKACERVVVDKLSKKNVLRKSSSFVVTEVNSMQLLRGRPPFIEFISSTIEEQTKHHHLLMEFFDGRTMENMGTDEITVATLQKMMRQACSALQYVHAEGLIHRDVKSANILVNSQHEIKLIGFNFATSGPEAYGVSGTYGFIAPEIMNQEYFFFRPPYSYAADYFSLGATIYHLCYRSTLGDIQPDSRKLSLEEKKEAWRKAIVYYPHTLPKSLMSFLKGLLMRYPDTRLQDDSVMDHQFLQLKNPSTKKIVRDEPSTSQQQ